MDIIDSGIDSLLKQSYRDAPGQYECLLLVIEKHLESGLTYGAKTRESLDSLRQHILLKKAAAAEPLFPGASASAYWN